MIIKAFLIEDGGAGAPDEKQEGQANATGEAVLPAYGDSLRRSPASFSSAKKENVT